MTGLSPLLYPTYLRHKKWLAYFLEWLAKTARSSGTVDDIFVVEQAQQNKGKQKGKKRQLDEQTTFEISLNSYIRLAEAVARDKGVIVPNQMIYFLRDIVRARKDCLAFYAYQGKGSQSAEQRRSSDSHIKAVEILKNVLQILEPLCPAADTKHQPDPKAPQQITNIYEVLPPEEPEEPGRSEWLPDSPAYQLPKKKVDYYQPKSSEGDKFFAIYCFLKDLSEIRFDVCRVWGEYKNRKISLSTAALTMSAAIEIFERLNNELLDEFPDFDDHRKIFEYAVKGHNDSKTNPAPGDPSDVFREHEAGGLKVSPGTLSCSFTIKFVEAFILSPQIANEERFKEGKSMWPPEVSMQAANEKLPGAYKELLRILTPMWVTYSFDIVSYDNGTQIDDGFTKAIETIWQQKRIPTWTVFTIQLFIDTQRELGSEIQRGFEDFQANAKWDIGYIEEFLRNDINEDLKRWREDDEPYHAVKKSIETLMKDLPRRYAWKLCGKVKNWEFQEQWFFLKRHPMLCGILLQSFQTQIHFFGTRFSSWQLSIINFAHLYNAALQSGKLAPTSQWNDLELIIEKQGEAQIFVGSRTMEHNKWAAHHAIALGISIVNFSNNKATDRFAKRNHRSLKQCRWAAVDFEGDSEKPRATRAKDDFGHKIVAIVKEFLNEEEAKLRPTPKKPKQRNMTARQTLSVFTQALKDDELMWNFNFFAMNQRCHKLLHEINVMCRGLNPAYHGDGELAGTTNLLLKLAADPHTEDDPLNGFEQTCQTMQDCIKNEGNAEIERAKRRMNVVDSPEDESYEAAQTFEDLALDDISIPEGCKPEFLIVKQGGEERDFVEEMKQEDVKLYADRYNYGAKGHYVESSRCQLQGCS